MDFQRKLGFNLVIISIIGFYGFLLITVLFGIPIENYYILLMYVLLTIIIIIERNNLQEFRIDKISLILLALSTFARRRLGFDHENIHLIIIGFCGLLILITFINKWKTLPNVNSKWVIISFILSFIIMIPFSYILGIEYTKLINYVESPVVLLIMFVRNFIYFMTVGVVFEEFLFRGFLWGYLVRSGLTEWKLMVLQGIAFWFIHLGSITYPIAFFIVIPFSTFLFSYLRKSSNSLFPSIIGHLFLNTLIALAGYRLF